MIKRDSSGQKPPPVRPQTESQHRKPPRRNCEPRHMPMSWTLLLDVRNIQILEHRMFIDTATFIGAFAAGYGLRAWISARRRHAMRKARGD
jgi:hypothetical protein